MGERLRINRWSWQYNRDLFYYDGQNARERNKWFNLSDILVRALKIFN